jgi:hypothetical protein
MNRVILLAVLSILFFASCSKSKIEDKIIGDWKQLSVGQNELDNADVKFTFTGDYKLYRTTIQDNNISIDTGAWSLDVRFANKNLLVIENLDNGLHFDGKHLIHELKDYMELQRVEYPDGHSDGSFYWSEFEKQ